MNYRFPYQKVLEYKEKQQDLAEQEFGVVKQKQFELEQELEGLQSREQGIFDEYNQVHQKKVADILEIQAGIKHVHHIKRQLEHKTVEVHKELEAKQQVLLERSQEAKIWNKWKAKSRASFIKEMDQKEQAMLDEMAVIRYSRKI
jgi:flagellar protein FliJ